jgi:alpha-tubulin suppressor-like RCC1 family protein
VTRIAAGGAYTCAVQSTGSSSDSMVLCWGDDYYGQLGDGHSGSGQQRLYPFAVNNF